MSRRRPLLVALAVIAAALLVPACEGVTDAYRAGMFNDTPEGQP